MVCKMYWLQAITSLHVGSGKGVGFIDMPIMREKVTNWPLVPGSAIKGVMRDHFEQKGVGTPLINTAFGQGGTANESNAGALVLTDAHIVCMPVRSLYGTFAYVTSPLVLERLKRDLIAAGVNTPPPVPSPNVDSIFHSPATKLAENGKIFFEDLDFNAQANPDTGTWADSLARYLYPAGSAWQNLFKERFAVVADNIFNFLTETGTDVAARIRIDDEKKIVAKGALWYEESLPAEAILAGIAWCDRIYEKPKQNGNNQQTILDTFCKDDLSLQIGGKANVGKGNVVCRFSRG